MSSIAIFHTRIDAFSRLKVGRKPLKINGLLISCCFHAHPMLGACARHSVFAGLRTVATNRMAPWMNGRPEHQATNPQTESGKGGKSSKRGSLAECAEPPPAG